MALSPKNAFTQYPLGIRYILLSYYKDDNFPSFYKEANKLENMLVDRNTIGYDLEKENKVEEAIIFYEQNIADMIDTPHPYERLRIIYTRQKNYPAAIRVCQAYIDMSNSLANAVIKELGDQELAQQLRDAGKFPEHINKLKTKLTTKPLQLKT